MESTHVALLALDGSAAERVAELLLLSADAVATADAITSLVELLCGDIESQATAAAHVMSRLVRDSDAYHYAVFNAGGIAALVRMIDSRVVDQQVHATSALVSICRSLRLQYEITNCGAIPRLIQALTSSPQDVKRLLVRLINRVLRSSVDRAADFIQAGGIEALLDYLPPHGPDPVLIKWLDSSHGVAHSLTWSGILPELVRIIRSGTEARSDRALRVLQAMGSHWFDSRRHPPDEAFQLLVSLVWTSPLSRARDAVAKLHSLSASGRFPVGLSDAGVIHAMVHWLSSCPRLDDQSSAVRAIDGCLATERHHADYSKASTPVSALVEASCGTDLIVEYCMAATSPDDRHVAAATLAAMVTIAQRRVWRLPGPFNDLDETTGAALDQVTVMLWNLAEQDEPTRESAKQPVVLNKLVHLVANGSDTQREFSARILGRLARTV